MTVNDVLDLVDLRSGYTPQVVWLLVAAVLILGIFPTVAFGSSLMGNSAGRGRKFLTFTATWVMSAAIFFLVLHPVLKLILAEAVWSMSPTKALSELYGVEISNPSGKSEKPLLLGNFSQTGYRATIDGEVRNLTIETIDGEYRITYVDPEHLVEVAPE